MISGAKLLGFAMIALFMIYIMISANLMIRDIGNKINEVTPVALQNQSP